MKGKKLISTLKAQEKNVSRVSSIIPKSPSLKWLDQSRNFLRVGWLTPLIHDTINNSQFLKYSLRIFQTLGAQRADWEKVASFYHQG